MAIEDCQVIVGGTRGGGNAVPLGSYLEPDDIEAAESEANAWIKSLRHASIAGRPWRDAFTHRGDSLWWFAELYLHKRRAAVEVRRAIFALDRLIARHHPSSLTFVEPDAIAWLVGQQMAGRHGIQVDSRGRRPGAWRAHLDTAVRSLFHATRAIADRLRPGTGAAAGESDVAVFVHTAFWRPQSGEAYIGAVLEELAARVPAGRLHLVGLGPRTNFRARDWRQRFAEFGDPRARQLPLVPVELYAGREAIKPSASLWRHRRAILDALEASADLRQAALVRGCDVWPLLRAELRGISHLQFPWSAQAMDEAGAALDALRPAVAVTYAEAGGWGRALVLEARRRNIPVVGLQHGFIYRHWLNYRHEADEMRGSPFNAADRGFPRPDVTLVYDRFAADHLVSAGHFPPESVRVTGSPRLDAFVETARGLTAEDRGRVRAAVGAAPGQHVVVVASKYAQIRPAFGALVDAVRPMTDVRLVVKCHPAETAGPYERAAADATNVTVAPASADLASLAAVARVLVTVNSTAAIEVMPLEVPALVVALPNNLSPFVEAGAMAGATGRDEIRPQLSALLYDEGRRAELALARRRFIDQYDIASDSRAAARAAEAILAVAGRQPPVSADTAFAREDH